MTMLLDPQFHFDLLQRPPRLLYPAMFGLSAVTGLVSGLSAMGKAPPQFHLAVVVLAVLAALVNALFEIFLHPVIFTWLSRRVGASTDVAEIRLLSALSLIPTCLGLILTSVTGLLFFGTLGGLGAAAIFIYGLSLANGTDLTAALRHTLALWGIMLLCIIAFATLRAFIHHP